MPRDCQRSVKHFNLSHLLRPVYSFIMLQLQLSLQFQFQVHVREWQTRRQRQFATIYENYAVRRDAARIEVEWLWAVVIAAVTVWLRNWRQANNCERQCSAVYTVINQTNLRISQERRELRLFTPLPLAVVLSAHPRCDTCCKRGWGTKSRNIYRGGSSSSSSTTWSTLTADSQCLAMPKK